MYAKLSLILKQTLRVIRARAVVHILVRTKTLTPRGTEMQVHEMFSITLRISRLNTFILFFCLQAEKEKEINGAWTKRNGLIQRERPAGSESPQQVHDLLQRHMLPSCCQRHSFLERSPYFASFKYPVSTFAFFHKVLKHLQMYVSVMYPCVQD